MAKRNAERQYCRYGILALKIRFDMCDVFRPPFIHTLTCVRGETTAYNTVDLGAVDPIAHIFGGSAIHAYKDLNSGYATGYMSNWS